jgi:hypothetical protein
MAQEHGIMESITTEGHQLVDQVKRALREGNVRRVRVKQDGRAITELQLTVGLIGAALAPVVAVLADCTIEIERIEDTPAPGEATTDETGAAPHATWPRTHEPPTAGL